MEKELTNIDTRKVVVTVEIEYSVTEHGRNLYDKKDRVDEDLAIYEVIKPNFHTVNEGVRLNAVKVISPDREFYADYEDNELK